MTARTGISRRWPRLLALASLLLAGVGLLSGCRDEAGARGITLPELETRTVGLRIEPGHTEVGLGDTVPLASFRVLANDSVLPAVALWRNPNPDFVTFVGCQDYDPTCTIVGDEAGMVGINEGTAVLRARIPVDTTRSAPTLTASATVTVRGR